MLVNLWLFTKREWRDSYFCWGSLFAQFSATLVTLTVFWYTSKAFSPSLESGLKGQSYFSYIVIAELVFFIPVVFFNAPILALRRYLEEGTLDSLIMVSKNLQQPVLSATLAAVPREFVFLLFFVLVACGLFGFSLQPEQVFLLLALNLLAFPVYLGLGLITCAVYLTFGRGAGLIQQLCSFLVILAGAYFPLSVIPQGLASWASLLSPFNLLLESSRQLVGDPRMLTVFFQSAKKLLIWALVVFPLGYFLLGQAYQLVRRRGSYLPVVKTF